MPPFCCCAASRRWPSASSARTKARSGLPSSSAGILRWRACTIQCSKGHPDYAIAKKQMAGAGAVLSLEVEGSGADACRLAEALNLFTLAPSLGSVDSLVTIPLLTSHTDRSGAAEQNRRDRANDPPVGRHRTCRRPDRRSGKRVSRTEPGPRAGGRCGLTIG